jgi:hypothetical protein
LEIGGTAWKRQIGITDIPRVIDEENRGGKLGGEEAKGIGSGGFGREIVWDNVGDRAELPH